MDHKICHFEIPVDDLERASTFYKSLFGWKIGPMMPEQADMIWMVNTAPSEGAQNPAAMTVNGMLIKRQNPGHPFANYVHVESVDEYGAKAVELGGKIALPKTPVPGMGYFAYILDTEGTIVGLWENDPTAAAA